MNQLIDELGLQDETLLAPSRTPRYILRKRRLHAVPLSPIGFLTTGLLSLSGKWRLLREPWIKRNGHNDDESLQDFAERRLGAEATHHLLAPFVAGVWASDIATLSASAAFPKLRAWERDRGSLLRGAARSKKGKGGLLGFKNGMSALTQALEQKLDGKIVLKTAATKISRSGQMWRVETSDGHWDAAQVLLASPADALAPLVREISPLASATLELIRYAPLAVVHMGFKPGDLQRRHKGFGYLTLPSEKPDILGCVWSSDIFPDRAPDGHTLLTVFAGGSLNPAMVEMPDGALEDHVINALNTVMNVRRRPALRRVTRYDQAIPQYTSGYAQRMEILSETERDQPGLHFIGNIRGGISVGDVIRSSKTCVARLPSASTHQTP